jgi:naringenin degradation protein FdeE
MSRPVDRVLVSGGGPAGMAAAIGFARRGVTVTLVEADPEWKALGMGLTLLGPTLRALDSIGAADACAAVGFAQDHADFHNAVGEVTAVVPFPAIADERLPPAVCITRPAFHRAMSGITRDLSVDLRLGVSIASLEAEHERVVCRLTDSGPEHYDLLVVAEGLHSQTRETVFGSLTPRFTGQAVWRTLIPRPAALDVYQMFYGRKAKVGLVPVSEESLYVFAVQNVSDDTRPPRDDRPKLMAEVLDADSDLIDYTRAEIAHAPEVTYNPTEALLVPPPWHRGPVVLIGDAAHTTTPHLAFGAGIAVEDAIVLCELTTGGLQLEEALRRYTERRYERCRLVVENSVQLGHWEQHPADPEADPVRLTRESWDVLREPL